MDIIKNFRRNKTAFIGSILRRISWMFPNDALYLRMLYLSEMHRVLHLNNPVTFNEKLQWLKLNDRKAEYTTMVDKYAVKEFVSKIIGKEYIIPTLGVWEHFDEIDFDLLPDKFVLKTTHGGGGMAVVVCDDKAKFDKAKAKEKLEKSLKDDIYSNFREFPYKNVKKRIIVEKFMCNSDGTSLQDYKVHNFNGTPRLILVCSNRFSGGAMGETFFDENWNKLDLRRPGHPNPYIEKPELFDKVLELSRILSKNIPFVRTDFYIIDGKVYFGEITFYPASGMTPFVPEKYDYMFGSWLAI